MGDLEDWQGELVIVGLASTKSFLVSSRPDIVVTPPGIVSVVDNSLTITLAPKDPGATQFNAPILHAIHLDSLSEEAPPQLSLIHI